MRAWLLVLLLAFGAAGLWLALDPRRGAVDTPAGATRSTAANGLALALAWTASRGPATTLHRAPIDLPATAVVLRWQPLVPKAAHHEPGEASSAPLVLSAVDDAFLRRGGRLVLGLDQAFGGLALETTTQRPDIVLPLLGSARVLVAPTVRTLDGRGTAGALLADAQVVAAAQGRPVIVRIRRGLGDLWLVAIPEIFSNHHLAEGDHVALLAGLVGDRPVWFDETIHGEEAGAEVLDLLRTWGFGPLLALLALATGIGWWRAARPLGQPEHPAPIRAAEAVEGVEALAALLGRAASDTELVAAQRERLARRLARRRSLTPAEAAALLPPATTLADLAPLQDAHERLLRP